MDLNFIDTICESIKKNQPADLLAQIHEVEANSTPISNGLPIAKGPCRKIKKEGSIKRPMYTNKFYNYFSAHLSEGERSNKNFWVIYPNSFNGFCNIFIGYIENSAMNCQAVLGPFYVF